MSVIIAQPARRAGQLTISRLLRGQEELWANNAAKGQHSSYYNFSLKQTYFPALYPISSSELVTTFFVCPATLADAVASNKMYPVGKA